MNTDTGLIYPPELMQQLGRIDVPTTPPAELEAFMEERREEMGVEADFRQLVDRVRDEVAAGVTVPVSDRVAQAQKVGQRELERRERRRKSAKQARKRARRS